MLNERSKQLRREILNLSLANGGYHFGGCFSCVEILMALYDEVFRPGDRFILSKGHACWTQYVMLRERGFQPKLEGHPHRDPYQGITWTSGSLGHGFPAAVGMALARKRLNKPGRVFVLMGDGECQEGTTWESILLANKFRLGNLCVIVDNNRLQACGLVNEILPTMPMLIDAARTAGFHVMCVDGHDVGALVEELSFKGSDQIPKMIIANTTKGKGVSFMENEASWHSRWPNKDELGAALAELQ